MGNKGLYGNTEEGQNDNCLHSPKINRCVSCLLLYFIDCIANCHENMFISLCYVTLF